MARKTSGVRSDFLPEGDQKCVLLCPDYCCWASQAQRQPTVTLWHSTNPIADFDKAHAVAMACIGNCITQFSQRTWLTDRTAKGLRQQCKIRVLWRYAQKQVGSDQTFHRPSHLRTLYTTTRGASSHLKPTVLNQNAEYPYPWPQTPLAHTDFRHGRQCAPVSVQPREYSSPG